MRAERLLLSFFFVLFVAFVVKHLVSANGCFKKSRGQESALTAEGPGTSQK